MGVDIQMKCLNGNVVMGQNEFLNSTYPACVYNTGMQKVATRNFTKLIIATVLALTLISACTVFSPQPTESPTDTPTNVPALRSTYGATPTFIYPPTRTATPFPTITATPLISPTPLTYWRGLPIIPGAFNTVDEGNTLSYKVFVEIDLVVAYYKEQMPALGWLQLSETADEFGNGLYLYSYGKIVITISITQLEPGSETVVLIIVAR